MAKKRMLSIDVIESDEFCSLPASAQCLYFHLCMNADNDNRRSKLVNFDGKSMICKQISL